MPLGQQELDVAKLVELNSTMLSA